MIKDERFVNSDKINNRDVDAIVLNIVKDDKMKSDIILAIATNSATNEKPIVLAEKINNIFMKDHHAVLSGSLYDTQQTDIIQETKYSIDNAGLHVEKGEENKTYSWSDVSNRIENMLSDGRFTADRGKKNELDDDFQIDSVESDRLKDEAQKKIGEATRAEQILAGARNMPKGMDANIYGVNSNATQESVIAAIDRAGNEINDLRSSANIDMEKSSIRLQEAFSAAREEATLTLGPEGIVTKARNDVEYTGKVIGFAGEIPNKVAIQQISDNQAVLFNIRDIAQEAALQTIEELVITSHEDSIDSVVELKMLEAQKQREKEIHEESHQGI
jgi:hypothetical protein